jgi:outer membrane receptor protein involved in Fe transport
LLQSDHTSSWAGLTLKQMFVTGLQRFQAGASGELRQVEGSPNIGRRRNSTGSVWGIEELMLGEGTQVAGFGRLEQYLHGTYGGIGADARIALLPWLTASGGISHSRRLPTYQELYWTGDSVTRSNDIRAERHLVAEAGFDIRPDSLTSISVAWFHRTVDDPIMILATGGSGVLPALEFTNAGKVRTMGFESTFRIRIWLLTLEGVGTWVIQKDENGARLGTLPRLSGQSGLYYWNEILNGNLTIKAGFRGRYQSAAAGERFIPELAAYVPNTLYEPGRGSAVDFLLFARIGNAHIHFLWTNLTGARYFTTPFYPARDREIRFGLTWQFLD